MKLIFFLSLFIIPLILPFSFAQESDEIKNLQILSLEKIEEEKFDDALKLLDKIIEIDPNNVFAYNNKGAILLEQEKYAESISVLEKSIQINENNTQAWNNKGIAHIKTVDFTKALTSFYNSLKHDSQNQVAFDNIKKLSESMSLVDYSSQGYGVLQIMDRNGNLIGSSKIVSIGLLPGIGIEVLKERSEIIQLNDKENYLTFRDVRYQPINEFVAGMDISIFKGSDQIMVGEFKTHGYVAHTDNIYIFDLILFDV